MSIITNINDARKFAGLTIDTSETQNAGVFMGLFGPGGGGKTTTLAEIVHSPLGTPALLVDSEGGSSSVVHLKKYGLDIVHVDNWRQILSVRKELNGGGHGYKSVIHDHLTEMAQLYKLFIAPDGIPRIQDWGKILTEMMEFVRESRRLTIKQQMNVFFVAWEELKLEKETEILKASVQFQGQFQAAFPGMVTMLGRLTVPHSKPPYLRKLSFAPSERSDAKYRVAPTEDAANIPLELYLKEDSRFICDFVATVREGVPFPIEKYLPPQKKKNEE